MAAEAQGTTEISITCNGAWNDGERYGYVLERGPASTSGDCASAGFTGRASSSAVNGQLRQFNSVSAPSGKSNLEFAMSDGTWTDRLIFSGQSPAEIEYRFRVHLSMSRSANSGEAYRQTNFDLFVTFGPSSVEPNILDATWVNQYIRMTPWYEGGKRLSIGDRFLVEDLRALPNSPLPLDVPVDFEFAVRVPSSGLLDPMFKMQLNTFSSIDGGAASSPMFATTDASSTVGISGLRFFDANGDELLGLDYRFANGTEFYRGPATTVPEPGTWALMATGILGIAVMRLRRRVQ